MRIRFLNIQIFRNLNGTWRLEAEIEERFIAPLRRFLAMLKGRAASAELKLWREQRSADANKYAWVLIDMIAAELRLKPVEVYRSAIREIGGNNDIITLRTEAVAGFAERWSEFGIGWQTEIISEAKTPGFTHIRAYFGSSKYDTEQMSRLIDSLVQDAKALGLETLPPAELERMMEQWQRASCKQNGNPGSPDEQTASKNTISSTDRDDVSSPIATA
ncbi:MAG: hypothetical protein VB034_02395 [Eubacteriales bacterium]|nr:hypothetical protein [Eubacteriales bacterium]